METYSITTHRLRTTQNKKIANHREAHYLRRSCTKHVKTMIISLRIRYLADPRSLKKVSSNGSSGDPSTLIKLNLNKLAKTTTSGISKEGTVFSNHNMHKCGSYEIKRNIITEFSDLELLFLTVFAFPNASRTGFDCIRKNNIPQRRLYERSRRKNNKI